MYLNEIRIKNYKSIQELTIPVKKYGDSFSSIFVGLNEAGKSNLLEAISLLSDAVNAKTYNYKEICNRHSEETCVDLYYQYKFDNEDEWKKEFKKNVNISKKFEDVFKLESYEKNVYLMKNKTAFTSDYLINWQEFRIEDFSFSNNTIEQNGKIYTIKHNSDISESEKNNYTALDEEKLYEILQKTILSLASLQKQKLTVWKPEDKYLITKSINLKDFAEDNSISVPLTNLFTLCGLDTKEKIKEKILSLTAPETRTLSHQLSKSATQYINEVWKEHGISIDVDIENSTKILNVHIMDKDNEDEFFGMNERSQGFKHFISLILHLSISNKKEKCKNQIILIDEPENHLHPSGIRYMRDELLKIGGNNFVFVATHSPFMIDNKNMERHFIVKKIKGETQIKQINSETILADEEVLRMGFGINILKDLLTPYKILVEGKTDFNIFRKSINCVNKDICVGITNGQGGNIVQVASLLKYSEVGCLVIVDDDGDGHSYKDKIIELGYPFSVNNVVTIRDLCGDIIANGTIEDTLGTDFVKSQINKIIKQEQNGLNFDIEDPSLPVLENLKIFLHKNGLGDKADDLLYRAKINIGENFNTSNFATKNPILKKLTENVISKIKGL